MVFQFVVILLPRLADLASEFCRVLRANRRSAGRIRAPTRVSRNLGCLAEPGVTIRPLRRGDSAARGMPASHDPLAPFDGPPQAAIPPGSGCLFWHVIRGWRGAQPPANGWHPSGMILAVQAEASSPINLAYNLVLRQDWKSEPCYGDPLVWFSSWESHEGKSCVQNLFFSNGNGGGRHITK